MIKSMHKKRDRLKKPGKNKRNQRRKKILWMIKLIK